MKNLINKITKSAMISVIVLGIETGVYKTEAQIREVQSDYLFSSKDTTSKIPKEEYDAIYGLFWPVYKHPIDFYQTDNKGRIRLENKKIIYLDANKIDLKELPESIGNLKSLGILYLDNNQLKSIPESIGNLKSLGILYLDNNKLESIPESIGNLKSLKWLYLDNNKLESIPESIGNLDSLKELRLDNNQLESIPKSIGNLKKLEHLSLVKNQLNKKSIKFLQELGKKGVDVIY